MDIVLMLALGGLVGWAARARGPGLPPGPLAAILAGAVGSLLAGALASRLGVLAGPTPMRWLPPLLGAALVVTIERAVRAVRSRPSRPAL